VYLEKKVGQPMPDIRNYSLHVAFGLVALAFIGEVAWQKPIIRVAILDAQPGRRLEKDLETWRKEHQLADTFAEKNSSEIHVFAFNYEELYSVVTDPSKLAEFDAVMIDDPWMATLVENDQLDAVPVDTFAAMLPRFAPEFLRTSYYRKQLRGSRRPTLSWVKAAMTAPTKNSDAFGLYALPYVGNAQSLVTVGSDITSDSPALRTWSGIRDNLARWHGTFYSRLGTNNSALVDFLPLLWANGGCLVAQSDNGEVSGLEQTGFHAATTALQMSKKLAEKSSVQYTRFKDEEVNRSLTQSDSDAVGVSWLAYRVKKDSKTERGLKSELHWHPMPGAEPSAEIAPICQSNEERLAAKDAEAQHMAARENNGAFGLWSLAVPRRRDHPKLAWGFVKWALDMRRNDRADRAELAVVDESCKDCLEKVDDKYFPTPFEDQMTPKVKDLIRRSRPRVSHPDWFEIEAAIGFRIREAHWGTKRIDVDGPENPIRSASKDLSAILNRRRDLDRDKANLQKRSIFAGFNR
jgi:hypothetical protein